VELNERQQLAALEGWATNPAVPVEERLQAALHVIEGLRRDEPQRTKAAVAAALGQAADIIDRHGLGALRRTAGGLKWWTPSGDGHCPVCGFTGACVPGCALKTLREELS